MTERNNNNQHDNNDVDVDIDIDQDFKFKLEQETDVDVDTSDHTKSEYVLKVDVPEGRHKTEVDIDINEDKRIKEEHVIKLNEYVKKDIDININENVDKEVTISTWNIDVDVDSKNIIDGSDNDINDLDNQKLIDVGQDGLLKMDDFTVSELAIGKSFNGRGNDSQYSVNQSNSLTDNDKLIAPSVAFIGLDGKKPHHGDDDDNNSRRQHDNNDGKDDKDGSPFQKVNVEGGDSNAGDGIDGNSNADNNGSNGSISGDAFASADGIATVNAFTQDIDMGSNTQGNFTTLDVVGGDRLDANNITFGTDEPAAARTNGGDEEEEDDNGRPHDDDDDGHHGGNNGGDGHDGGLAIKDSDDDINDLDAQSLINVGYDAEVFMDDFSLDTVAIGKSFNGPGNDMQFDVTQVNDLVDNDFLLHPTVKYIGANGAAFQDVRVEGGDATAGDGIKGDSSASQNGLNGSISGSTAASADAIAHVGAFTQNIVMGANLQVNNFTASVVGGDSTIADDVSGLS